MPANLLILPLLAGFCFVHFSHRFRYRAQRLDGYRLLLESALAGAVLFLLARLAALLLGDWLGPAWLGLWQRIAPVDYLGTGLLSLTLGLLLPLIDNVRPSGTVWRQLSSRPVWRRWPLTPGAFSEHHAKKARDAEIVRHGTALVRLLHEAEKDQALVSITLDSRKWYVGYVAEAISLDPQEQYFRLLPILSGHRDKDTLQAVPTTYYWPLYRRPDVEPRTFVVTLPLKDVKVANRFDEALYEAHFAGAGQRSPGPFPAGGGPAE